jgi:spore coat polysaccharide biosynthesis predicted glycosyltransferase SpsG
MNFGLLAGTGKSVGLGHLKRCLSIAVSLRKLSHVVEFITEDEFFNDWIHEYGFSYRSKSNLKRKYDIIVVDRYQVDERFLLSLKEKCDVLARIDDASPLIEDKVSDILINSNPNAKENLYDNLLRPNCYLILGKDFVPMEEKFCRLRDEYKIRPSIRNITLTFGGSDNKELIKKVCERVNGMRTFAKIFVLNGTILKSELRETFLPNLELLPLVKNIEYIFSMSDLVICSAGTTCWQLCAIGIPFICFQTADNQEHNYNYIKNMNIGIALEQDALSNGIFEKELNNLNLSKRQSLYSESRQRIDCKGSDRIAHALTKAFTLYLK